MAAQSSAELLIRIAADPSGAEESIRKFRANFSGDLGGITTQLARWSASGATDFGRMQTAALNFTGRAGEQFGALDQVLNRNRQSSALWRSDFVSNLDQVRSGTEALQGSLVQGMQLFDSALSRNISTAVIWQKSIGEAFRNAAAASIGALAQEAIVRAIYSTALGFYLLAIRDFRGASNAFQSAAIFGAVGGVAALAGRALASESGGAQKNSSTQSSESPQSSAATAGAPQTESKPVQVIFQGPVYGGQAGIDELVRHISSAVTDRDVNLVAYTVVRQPATRA
jgi:hypothetical protein